MHAAQAGDFWIHCNCGANETATRLSPGGSDVDSVDTGVDLGEKLYIRALAFDAAGGALWISGFAAESGEGRLVRVETNIEPDHLQLSGPFSTGLRALAFDGSALWGLTADTPASVLRIDPLNGNADATFTVPDATVEWIGVAAVGGQIFLVGSSASGEGVLASFTPAP